MEVAKLTTTIQICSISKFALKALEFHLLLSIFFVAEHKEIYNCAKSTIQSFKIQKPELDSELSL